MKSFKNKDFQVHEFQSFGKVSQAKLRHFHFCKSKVYQMFGQNMVADYFSWSKYNPVIELFQL